MSAKSKLSRQKTIPSRAGQLVNLTNLSPKKLFRRFPMFQSRLFWFCLAFVLLVAVADRILENTGYISLLTDQGILFLEPMLFFWIPIIVATSDFGVSGALATTFCVILVNLPNWIMWSGPPTHLAEITTVLLIGLTSFVLGVQVDKRKAAQKRARTYTDFAAHKEEEVLRRLSLNIHDEPLQTLMSTRHRLDLIQNSPKSNQELDEVRTNIDKVVGELRGLLRDLRPTILEDLGVVSAIRQTASDMTARSGIATQLSVTGEELRLDSGVEIQLYRIAQEALRNVEKHSSAKNAEIVIAFLSEEIKLEISDDGIGLAESKLRKGYTRDGHYGILGMIERAELVQGRVEIKSRPGKGTRIIARIPIKPLSN